MAEKKSFDFENALEELTKVVESLEKGDLALDKSLKLFEEGIALTGNCQKALQKAEQKVQLLVEKQSKLDLKDFDNGSDE